MRIYIPIWYNFPFALKTSFNISYSMTASDAYCRFHMSEMALFCLCFWRICLLIGLNFSFCVLKMFPTVFSFALFPVRNLSLSLFLYNVSFFRAAFNIFSLSLVLSNFILMNLGIVFFMFLVLVTFWASLVCVFIVFIKCWKFSPLFLQIFFFCTLCAFFSPVRTIIEHTLTLSHRSVMLCSVFYSFFSSCLTLISITIFEFTNLSFHTI